MLTRWNDFGLGRWGLGFHDFDHAISDLATLRRQMDRWFSDFDRQFGDGDTPQALPGQWPRVSLHDQGSALLLRAELPGFEEKDLDITVHDTTLTLAGERRIEPPEGYDAHRRERGNLKFSRTATLPTKVEAEKSTATLKHGVLVLTLPKAPEAQPKQIAVKAS